MEENDFVSDGGYELEQYQESSWDYGAEMHDYAKLVTATISVIYTLARRCAVLQTTSAVNTIEIHVGCSR